MITHLRAAIAKLRRTDAAVLRARYTAAAGILLALGFTIPGVVDRWVGVGLAVFAFLGPWLQGRRTRADVWSQQTVDELTQLVAEYPEVPDVIHDMLRRGISVPIVRQYLQAVGGEHRAPVS